METNNNRIDIIIPSHNSPEWLALCLEEITRCRDAAMGEVLIVDDHSDADYYGVISDIVANTPDVRLVSRIGGERGFGASCNHGAGMTSAPIILFLNTDCLVAPGLFGNIRNAFLEKNIVMVCAPSNNSPELTYEMPDGEDYLTLNEKLSRQSLHARPDDCVMDACTVVGHCLAVRRDFFHSVGGFSKEWGIGYGEETDLHMKAHAGKFRGVTLLNSYVFHFGGGSFRHLEQTEMIRQKNRSLFMSKWKKEYLALAARVKARNPMERIRALAAGSGPQSYDILFFIPVINQTIGGIQTILHLCNFMIRNGLRSNCILAGKFDESLLKSYKEPMFFSPLKYASRQELLDDAKFDVKCLVSTIYDSAAFVSELARRKKAFHVQFIQGYEGYFENGNAFKYTLESYRYGDEIIVTSKWLKAMVSRHMQGRVIHHLNLPINRAIFFPSRLKERQYPLGVVLRNAPDKGQWILLEVIDRLVANGLKNILVIKADTYALPRHWTESITAVDMPIDQSLLSKYLRKTGIFLDASLHEGFGLMPLEALACGCWLVLSDSGGIRDYAIQNVNSDIISRLNQPEEYVSAIQARIGAGAAPDVIIESLASIPTDYKHYLDLFEKILKKEIHPRTHDEMDDSSSDDIRSELLQYLREIGQLNIEKNADELLSLEGGFAERFSFFTPFLPESAKERMLISGCAVGSEHFVADRHGFKEIYGTEVAGQYVNMAKRRFQKHDRFHVALYDGKRLPFKDGFFTTIYSGHIIEHTPSPYRYFAEHMRALAAGGFFFIEFPDRYHPVELHTGMKSCEWLPSPFRFIVLKFLASPRSGLSERKRKYYDLILKTLSPVSIWQIRLYLLAAGCPGSRVVACNKPAPGFVRILIQK